MNDMSVVHNATTRSRQGYSTGFTLIEIVVVLVVLGLLMAAAVPAYKAYQRASMNSVGKSLVHDLVKANIAFCSQNPSATPVLGGASGTLDAYLGGDIDLATASKVVFSGCTLNYTPVACPSLPATPTFTPCTIFGTVPTAAIDNNGKITFTPGS